MPRSDAGSVDRGTSAPEASDPVAARAIAWAVQLREGNASAEEHAEFQDWRDADPRHEAAAARMERALGRIEGLPSGLPPRQAMRRSLQRGPTRRQALRTIGVVLTGVGGGLLWSQGQRPLSALVSDFATGTGERRVFALQDGSRLWLNARSAVDQVFDGSTRHLHLRSGELIVEVASDTARPFIVHTAHGRVQALGTRFLVRQEDADSLVAVLHSTVRVVPRDGAPLTVRAGQSARFSRQEVIPERALPQTFAAWEDGFIEVHDRPLHEVVDALRPYHAGFLQVSPQAAGMRVTGTFPLEDVDRTLAALTRNLPIAVERRTRWWISIDLR